MATKARKTAARNVNVNANGTPAEHKPSPLDNVSYDALLAMARNAIDASLERETQNVKANQMVARAIMLYREKQIADGVAPLDLTKFKTPDSDSTALAKWRTSMAEKFIGKAPTARGGMDQTKVSGKDNYKAKRRIFDDACNLVCVFVNAGVIAEHFSDDRGCFAVPGSLLIPHDKSYVPDFELKDAMAAGASVPLMNTSYLIRDKATGKSTRTIRASVAQVLSAWKSKPPKQAAGSGTPDGDTASGNGANERTTSLDMKAIRAGIKAAPFSSLIRPFRDAIDAVRKDGWKPDDYTPAERNDMMSIAQAIMLLIQQDADANKAKADAAKSTPDNVVKMARKSK